MPNSQVVTSQKPAKLVIFDLDGTLIQTETLVLSVARAVVQAHGKELTEEAIVASLGRRPIDAWQQVIDLLSLENCTAEQLFDESEPILTERWHEAGFLPGAARLVSHLRGSDVRIALATSTSRATLKRKISSKPLLQDAFEATCCGDDDAVSSGKPAPDCFLHIANAMGMSPEDCVVIEDAPSGVHAAIAAGMRVVAVPSFRGPDSLFPPLDPSANTGLVEILPSLLTFTPEKYGLPPFSDYVGATVPLDTVLKISGEVVRGFGRGSKELGIPTANVDAAALRDTLAEAVTGIFAGWASLGESDVVYPMCMSVGWNPVFNNREKTCEPWLLHDFGGKAFYGENIRLVACAFIRPEANFPSIEALVQRIKEDEKVTRTALEDERYLQYKNHRFLLPPGHIVANRSDGVYE